MTAEKGPLRVNAVTAGPIDCSSIDEYRQHMKLTSEQLQKIVVEFEEQMKVGLQKDSNLLMIPTMVDVIPDGHESGDLYGIEIGGSKLRVVYTRLSEDRHSVEVVQTEEVLIPEEKKHCPASELFDYIVLRLLSFAAGIGRDVQKGVVIGLCFSFPIKHHSIKSGTLIKWTKGFENEGGVGKDPVELLAAAFLRKKVRANIEALVNDTVGILCATRYTSGPDANIAVIMGTGTNACYVEQTKNIGKWRLKYFPRTTDMVVNIELPGFNSQVLPQLAEDVQLDKESSHPGDQAFEKLTSGLYMGDIARRILYRLAVMEKWFERGTKNLGDPSRFSTLLLAAMAQDGSENLSEVASTLATVVGVQQDDVSGGVRKKAKEICRLVTERSAQLTAAAIVGILHHIERAQDHSPPRNIIAVDGGIFAEYTLYGGLVHEAVRSISGDEFADNFELKMTAGGAGFGAAAVAAAGYKYDKVMGHVADTKAPPRKFPPRGRSHTNLYGLDE